jgi:hypothetical protein
MVLAPNTGRMVFSFCTQIANISNLILRALRTRASPRAKARPLCTVTVPELRAAAPIPRGTTFVATMTSVY